MKGIFSRKFHNQTNNDFSSKFSPLDPKDWPKEWHKVYHKEYPRFPKIKLSEKILELGNFKNALQDCRSTREYDPQRELTLEELTTLLHYSAGVKPERKDWDLTRRHYPSGGARYPLEVYLGIQRVAGVKPGIYHYNLKDHLLEMLTSDHEYLESLKESLCSPWAREAAVFYIVTAAWDRAFMKYGDLGYRIILVEAGHLAQNLSLTAVALGVGSCNLMGFHNQRVEEILDIENEDEASLYLTLLGK